MPDTPTPSAATDPYDDLYALGVCTDNPPPDAAVRCWCCDMAMGAAHRVEADRQGCGPCLRAEARKGRRR